MPLSQYYKPLYNDPAFDRPLAQSAFMPPLPVDNETGITGEAPVIPLSPAVDSTSPSTVNPSLPTVTDAGASSQNPQSAMTGSKPSILDYLQNYNQGSAKSAIDNANKLAVNPDDIRRSQDRQNLLSLQQGLSSATSQIGNIGGKVADNDFAKYLENQVQGERNNLKQRQDAFASAKDQIQQSLKANADLGTQQYQEQLRPLEMQGKQLDIEKSQQDLEKSKVLSQISQIKAQNEAAMADPTSAASQATRGLLKRIGINAPDTMPGSQAQELLEQGVKVKASEDSAEAKKYAAQERASLAQARIQEAQARNQEKMDTQQQKRVDTFYKDLDPTNRSRGVFAGYQDKLTNAKAVERIMYEKGGTLKDLTPQEMHEAAVAMNRLLGGANAIASVHGLIPQTRGMDQAKILQWFTDKPQGTGQKEFAKWFAKSIAGEKELYEGEMKSRQILRAKAYDDIRKKDPDLFNKMLEDNGLTMAEYLSKDPNVTHTVIDEKTGAQNNSIVKASQFGKPVGSTGISAGSGPRRAWTPGG